MIVAAGQSFLAAGTPFTKHVTSCNDASAVAIGTRMLVSASHADARGPTLFTTPGGQVINSIHRKNHPRLGITKCLTDADVPGFHTLGSRPTAGDQLVVAGTGVNATYGDPAPATFTTATRDLRAGYGRASYDGTAPNVVLAAFENPVGGFQPSVTATDHDSGGGIFNMSGDLLAVLSSNGGFNFDPALRYATYSDAEDSGGSGLLVETARHWLESYDGVSIAYVEVLYTGEPETAVPSEAKVYGSDVGTFASETGTVVVNYNGTAYRNTAAPTTGTDMLGNTVATYALVAGGTLPSANCCTIANEAFTRTSDSAKTTAVTNLRYAPVRVYPTGGGTTLGTPQLRNDGASSELDISIYLSNAATGFQASTFHFDRAIQDPSLGVDANGVMFRGLFSEGWTMLADALDANPAIVRVAANSSVNRNSVVTQSAANVGTPAGQGVVNINGGTRTTSFVVDGGDGTSKNAEYENLRASFASANVTISADAGSFTAISRTNNSITYFEFTAPYTGTVNVTKTGTVTTAGSGWLIRVSRLDSVAPLTHIAEAANVDATGVPIVSGGRYLVGIRNLSGSTGTLGATLALTEVIPPPASTGFLSAGRRRMPGGHSRRRCFT